MAKKRKETGYHQAIRNAKRFMRQKLHSTLVEMQEARPGMEPEGGWRSASW